MVVVAMIPPIVDGDATILDLDEPLSIVCYWVIPYTVLGIAGTIPRSSRPGSTSVGRGRPADRGRPAGRRNPRCPPTRQRPSRRAGHRGPGRQPAGRAVHRVDRRRPRRVDHRGDHVRERPFRPPVAVARRVHRPDGRRRRPRPRSRTGSTDRIRTGRPRTALPRSGRCVRRRRRDPEMFVPPAEPWQLTIDAHGVGAIESTQSGTAGRPVAGRRTVLRRPEQSVCATNPPRRRAARDAGAAGRRAAGNGLACSGLLRRLGGWLRVATLQRRGARLARLCGPRAGVDPEADAAVNVSEVPLERFAEALTLLAGHESVDRARVSAMAISRGSEGCWRNRPRSRLRRCGGGAGQPEQRGLAGARLVRGGPGHGVVDRGREPVPWVPVSSGVLMRQIIRNAWTVGRDIAHQRPTLLRLRPAYEASLVAVGLLDRHGQRSPRCREPCDGHPPPAGSVLDATRSRCPLLMLAGRDDQLWPSVPMARMLAAQRSAAGMDRDDQLSPMTGPVTSSGSACCRPTRRGRTASRSAAPGKAWPRRRRTPRNVCWPSSGAPAMTAAVPRRGHLIGCTLVNGAVAWRRPCGSVESKGVPAGSTPSGSPAAGPRPTPPARRPARQR